MTYTNNVEIQVYLGELQRGQTFRRMNRNHKYIPFILERAKYEDKFVRI